MSLGTQIAMGFLNVFLEIILGYFFVWAMVNFCKSLWLAVKATALKAWKEDRRFVTAMACIMAVIIAWAVIAPRVRACWLR